MYDLHLKSFERAKESWQLDGEQKLEQAKLFKDKGTLFFKVSIEYFNPKVRTALVGSVIDH